MLQIVYNQDEITEDNIKLTFIEHSNSLRITFNTKSMVNCYRKKFGNLTWILRVTDDKADGLFISDLSMVSDWTQVKAAMLAKTSNLTETNIQRIIDLARSFKQRRKI